MAKRKLGKNTLPLLAITALVLSVALVNYDKSLVSNSSSTQSVLSESDENKEDVKKEEKVEEKNREKVETKNEVRKEEKKEIQRLDVSSGKIRINSRIEVKSNSGNNSIDDIDDDSNDDDDVDEVDIDDENEVEDEIEDEDEDEDGTETETEEESETVSPDGTVNRFKLKIKTRTTAGKTIIETASGEVEVENNPEDTVNDLVENGLIDNPTTIEVKENEREKVEFEIQGTDSKKFLGIFKVVIPKTITVSSETGEVVSTNQNVWSRIISLLSI